MGHTIKNMPVSRVRENDRIHTSLIRTGLREGWTVAKVEQDTETSDYVLYDLMGNAEHFPAAARVTVYRD